MLCNLVAVWMIISLPFSATASSFSLCGYYVHGICGHDGKAKRESRPHNRLLVGLGFHEFSIPQLSSAILVSFPGASSGIGAATAILFSSLGADLALSGRNFDNLRKTAERCEAAKEGAGQKKPLLVQGIWSGWTKSSPHEVGNLFCALQPTWLKRRIPFG